jgi:hypothetical protein
MIDDIRRRRKELTTRVRSQCVRARARVKEQAKERRRNVLEALRIELREMKQAERNRCKLRVARVAHESEGARARAKREQRERAQAEAAARRIERHREKVLRSQKRRETQAESDDAVRSNLEPDLVPIFNVVKAKIRARPGMSRTEAFLHWAEENEGEIWAMRDELAERRLRALLAEERRARQGAGGARARRAKLSEAPF